MGRRYTTEHFSAKIETIRTLMPLACIAVDLIVGFPAESEALFEESYQFIDRSDISYLHVFTYSERENTRAIALSSTVPKPERQERSKAMQRLSESKKSEFLRRNHGGSAKVLWEKAHADGFMHGFTENYIKVKAPFRSEVHNQIQEVRLHNLDPKGWFNI